MSSSESDSDMRIDSLLAANISKTLLPVVQQVRSAWLADTL